MGVLTDLTDFVGLTDTEAAERAAEAAKFDPYNITSTFGGVRFEEDENKFYSSIDPTLNTLAGIQREEALRNWGASPYVSRAMSMFGDKLAPAYGPSTADARKRAIGQLRMQDPSVGLQSQLLGELSAIDPRQQLNLFRQMAAPFEEQQRLGLENRLFAQGLMGASTVDKPGGARRSLFDAQAQADLMRQTQAMDWANQQRQSVLGQYGNLRGLDMARRQQALGEYGTLQGMRQQEKAQDLAGYGALQGLESQRRASMLGQLGIIPGMEMGLFNPAMGFGQLGAAGNQAAASAIMQGNMATQNFLGSVLGGGLMGFGAGGGFG